MEPVSSSLAGACFALLLTFRSANMLNTTTTATTMLSRVWRLELSQGAATRFRIVRAPKPEKTHCRAGGFAESGSLAPVLLPARNNGSP